MGGMCHQLKVLCWWLHALTHLQHGKSLWIGHSAAFHAKVQACLRSCNDAISGGTPFVNDSSLSCKKVQTCWRSCHDAASGGTPVWMTAAYHAKSASLFPQLHAMMPCIAAPSVNDSGLSCKSASLFTQLTLFCNKSLAVCVTYKYIYIYIFLSFSLSLYSCVLVYMFYSYPF